jgi:hypothetical protein
MQFSQEEKLKKIREAPRPVKDFIGSDESSKFITRMKEKYTLSQDQKGVVGDVVNYTLLGLIQKNTVADTLKETGAFSEDDVTLIHNDIEALLSSIQKETASQTSEQGVSKKKEFPPPSNLPTEFKSPNPQEQRAQETYKQISESDNNETSFEKLAERKGKTYVRDPYREPIE